MIEVKAATEIDASAEAVWSVLTALEQFKTWNPFIRDARGTTEVGGEVYRPGIAPARSCTRERARSTTSR
jgi:uncharacterized protein YndB with AHSA1/START domain